MIVLRQSNMNNMHDLVSIIVPIYNKENLVGRCVDSLIAQTYKNIEIILIDDGSTDKSLLVCQSYKDKDSRIRVLHKSNGGLSDARNYGLAHATGIWVSFVDGDDYVENNYIETMLCNSEGANLVVCCCYQLTNQKQSVKRHFFGNSFLEDKKTIYNEIIIPMITLNREKNNLLFPVWNKLYRKQLIDENHLKFDTNLPYAEDYMFNVQIFKIVLGIRFIDVPLYYYDSTIPGTLSKVQITTKKIEHYIYIHNKVAELFPEKGVEVLPKLIYYNCKHHLKLYARLNGFEGFNSFSNDVYCMDAFVDTCKKHKFGFLALLRRQNQHSLFLFWAYLLGFKSFVKHYIGTICRHY